MMLTVTIFKTDQYLVKLEIRIRPQLKKLKYYKVRSAPNRTRTTYIGSRKLLTTALKIR